LLNEARAIFPNTKMAKDFMTYEVPRRRSGSELTAVTEMPIDLPPMPGITGITKPKKKSV
jgi:hypothetical protein